MKALIISDESNVINGLKFFLQDKGFDIIVYRWLLKALDNIEEIQPDCIILNTVEYPRHWKTLVQFVKSGIGGNKVGIFLYEPAPLSEDDLKKQELLGITGTFKDFTPPELNKFSILIEDFFGLDLLRRNLSKTEPKKEETVVKETEENNSVEEDCFEISVADIESNTENPKDEISGSFVMNHPETNAFIAGKFFDFNNKTLTVKPNSIIDLEKGTPIEYFTYFIKDSCVSSTAQVSEVITVNNEKLFVIELKENYENIQ